MSFKQFHGAQCKVSFLSSIIELPTPLRSFLPIVGICTVSIASFHKILPPGLLFGSLHTMHPASQETSGVPSIYARVGLLHSREATVTHLILSDGLLQRIRWRIFMLNPKICAGTNPAQQSRRGHAACCHHRLGVWHTSYCFHCPESQSGTAARGSVHQRQAAEAAGAFAYHRRVCHSGNPSTAGIPLHPHQLCHT